MTELNQSDDQSDDDMFADAPVTAKAEPVAEKVEKVEVPDEPEVVTTAEVKTESKTTEEAAPSKQDSVPMAVMIAERRKRQAAEDRLRELEGGAKIDPATEALNRTINISRDLMLDSHKDYPAMETIFMELVSEPNADGGIRITDSALYEKFRNSANPAKFAYNHAKQHKDYLDKSSPEYETKLRAQIEKEIRAKLSGSDASKLTNLTNLAASASNTQSPIESSPKDDEGIWD